ncbi:MAG: hypothetical protein D3909_02805 [Candidatus Electrothrix sp. ATG1]|nr:hypothetical protein [Candidatus Electrothrix sp. ATG1]
MERKKILDFLHSTVSQFMPQKIILGILAGIALMGMINFIAPYLHSSTSFDVEAIRLWHCISFGIVFFNRP